MDKYPHQESEELVAHGATGGVAGIAKVQTFSAVQSFSAKIAALLGAWWTGAASSTGPWASELIGRKTGIVNNTATGFITVTVANTDVYARIAVDYYVNSDQFSRVQTGRIHVLVVRTAGATTVTAIAEVDTQIGANAQGGETIGVTFSNSGNTGAVGATQTFNIQVTPNSSVGAAVERIVYRAKVLTNRYNAGDTTQEITIAAIA